MVAAVVAKIKCLVEIWLTDGTISRIQNWDSEVLNYQGKSWNYLPFNYLPFGGKIGDDNRTISIELPNVGSSQHGYLPVRDWVQNGQLAGAYVTATMFDPNSSLRAEQVYRVAERSLSDTAESGSTISIKLRKAEDRFARIMTQTYNNQNIGEGVTVRSF
jgi:hypothetical protein